MPAEGRALDRISASLKLLNIDLADERDPIADNEDLARRLDVAVRNLIAGRRRGEDEDDDIDAGLRARIAAEARE